MRISTMGKRYHRAEASLKSFDLIKGIGFVDLLARGDQFRSMADQPRSIQIPAEER